MNRPTRILPLLALLAAALLAPVRAGAQTGGPNRYLYRDLAGLPVEDVRKHGAKGDGSTDDHAAITRAVAAAKVRGPVWRGGIVYFPPGWYVTTQPIVLPRTDATPSNVVHLVGDNLRTSMIVGDSSFPAGRSVIEWEPTTKRTWFGRIANLGIFVPNVAGCRAIHFNQNQGTINTVEAVDDEWYQCDLENIEINCHNDYCQEMIRVDTAVRLSHWKNVYGNPVQGGGTYATRLISTRYQFDDGTYPGFRNDSLGIGDCVLEQINPMIITGGFAQAFKGRMYMSTWDTGFSNGAHSRHLPTAAYHFIDSYDLTLTNLGAEGYADTAMKFEKCWNVAVNQPSFGTIRPMYDGWAAATAYVVGTRVVSTALLNGNPQATANLYFTCTVAGTSGGSEPTWPTVSGNTVTDGGVTWQAAGPAVGEEVTLVECKGLRFRNRELDPASGVSSARATKAISIDSVSYDNVFENWTLRTVIFAGTPDGSASAATEVNLPSDDNRNHVSGMAVASFGNVRVPYQLGSHPHRPTRTAALDFGNIAAGGSATLTISVPGAAVNDDVRATPPSNLGAGLVPTAWVSANDTVTVRLFNATAGAIDPASGTWRAMIVKP